MFFRIMANINGVTWAELENEWPWRRVNAALEAIRQEQYNRAHPILIQAHAFLSVHRAKGAPSVDFHSLFLPSANPYHEPTPAVYTTGVIRAFSEAFKRVLTGNAHLAAFGAAELRASGWRPER